MGRVPRSTHPIAMRITEQMIAQADSLIDYVETMPGIIASGRKVTRGTVFRMAVALGLELLETQAREAEQAG